ncbi:MAG: UDP-N-acetylglucosamine transferase subunit ALG14 [Candidatus Diapherotrites archaeon]|nr:UDP-N-acetylglucosamine transferase subunit ALG14 [Candidatus Diapherotrites archaeon]
MKVCLAASGGGHLTELLQLKEAWRKYPHFYVSDVRTNSVALNKKQKVYFVVCPRRNPIKLIVNTIQALYILAKEKPDIVISTGADTAVPLCILAKLFLKKVIFIESFCRISDASLSAKIMYKFADLFFVQWPENKGAFPKAEYAGSVF